MKLKIDKKATELAKKKAKELAQKTHYSLLLYFILIASCVVLGTMGTVTVLTPVITNLLGISTLTMTLTSWTMLFIVVVSVALLFFLQKKMFEPIATLNRAMGKVSEGNFRQQLSTKSNITEIRESYASFNSMVKELDATEILQSDFVSNVSHEFKTPINAIEGYAALLQDASMSEGEHAQCVEKILFNTRRLSELVGNILLLSKVENKGILPQPTTYRLDEQIRDALLGLEAKWTQKDIEFDVDLEEITYRGNESLLYHVFSNLIGNAVKFDSAGGEVKLRLTQDDTYIVFTVQDDGPGLPAGAEAHIFDKFYQADSSRREEGNGLGLALVKQILDISNGTISVESISPHGCLFTVTLHK